MNFIKGLAMLTLVKRISSSIVLIGFVGLGRPLTAQDPRATPMAIGQIIDEVVDSLGLSRGSPTERKVVVDLDQTLSAFGYQNSGLTLADIAVRGLFSQGSANQLRNCRNEAKVCADAEAAMYVWIAPIMIKSSQARVKVNVTWADRAPSLGRNSTASGATISQYTVEVILKRVEDGNWRFLKRGVSIIP